jgi:hypothetical protein
VEQRYESGAQVNQPGPENFWPLKTSSSMSSGRFPGYPKLGSSVHESCFEAQAKSAWNRYWGGRLSPQAGPVITQ